MAPSPRRLSDRGNARTTAYARWHSRDRAAQFETAARNLPADYLFTPPAELRPEPPHEAA